MQGGSGESTCPSCGASTDAGEKFCAACGAAIAPATEPPPDAAVSSAASASPVPAPFASAQAPSADAYGFDSRAALSAEHDRKLAVARKWLVAISILTLVSGFIFYAINKSDVEKQIQQAEAQTAGIDPAVRDDLMKQQTGMTWAEAVAHDRGQVTMLLFINIGLALAYLGMWVWAKKNALAAAVVALLLFITVIGVNAVMEPATLAQGILVKVLFIAALAKAVSAAQEERKLAGQLATHPAAG